MEVEAPDTPPVARATPPVDTGTFPAPGIEKPVLTRGAVLIKGVLIPPPGRIPGRIGGVILVGIVAPGSALFVAPGKERFVAPGRILGAPGKAPGKAPGSERVLLPPGNG